MDNPLSLVPGEAAVNEFPVLKAFQEYIDAEQAKARKRMLGLSVFFVVLLVVVVITFVLVLSTVLNRNQLLSDKLVDLALNKDHDKQQQIVIPSIQPAQVQQPSSQELLKPLIDKFEREQATMKAAYEKMMRDNEAKAAAAEAARRIAADARERELDAEKAKIEKLKRQTEDEAARQAEIQRQLRRLYPEYYEDGGKVKSPSSSKGIRRETAETTPVTEPVKADHPANTMLEDLKPVTYFNDDDDDSVPFLIETPTKKTK